MALDIPVPDIWSYPWLNRLIERELGAARLPIRSLSDMSYVDKQTRSFDDGTATVLSGTWGGKSSQWEKHIHC